MSKSSRHYLFIILLSLIGVACQHVSSLGQEVDGAEGRGNRSGRRSARPPTFIDPQSGQRTEFAPFGTENQFAAQARDEAPSNQPRDLIALTVWDLTISDSTGPENDELVGNLIDKANNLPTVVGTVDEIRDLVSRLKAAGLLQSSREFRLLTIDGQQATAQTGISRPQIMATSIEPNPNRRGGRNRPNVDPQLQNPGPANQTNETSENDAIVTNSIQYRDIGTIVELRPRIDSAGGVQVQLTYNSSDMEKAEDVPLAEIPGRKPITADKSVMSQVFASVRLKSGTAVLVQADSSQKFGGQSSAGKTQLLILAASVQPALE